MVLGIFNLYVRSDLETRVRLGVTQCHQHRHKSIRRLRLPINIPLQPRAYLVPFPR